MGNKNIYIDNTVVDKVYIESVSADKIYIDTVLVWQNTIPWTLTIDINDYVASATYSINGGTAVTITSDTTLNLVDTDTVVVSGTAQSDVAYNYGAVTGGGTFSYNGSATQTCTLSCSRALKNFTVTFSGTYCRFYKDGNQIASQTVFYGDTLSVSGTTVTCSRNGTTAWSVVATEYSSTDQYYYGPPQLVGQVPETVTSDITIQYESTRSLQSKKITFALGGSQYGSWGSSSKNAYYGDTISRSGNTVTCYEGSSSTARWTNTFTNGSATGYTYSVSYSSITSPVTSTQTITATTSRTANTYTISYVMNDGVHSGSYASSYTYSSYSQSKSIGTATRPGYNGSVSTNVGSISGSNLTIPAGTTGTITVTWTWSLISYTISFSGTYCSWGSSSKTAYHGDTLSVSGTTVTCKSGSTTRWTNTATANSTTAQYSYGTPSISNGTGTVTGARTISATSTRTTRSYTVSFSNPSNGYWSSTSSISAPYGSTFSVSGNTVTINGQSRTLYANSTGWETYYYLYVSSVGVSNGTTLTGNRSLTGTISSAAKTYAANVVVRVSQWLWNYNVGLDNNAVSGYSGVTVTFEDSANSKSIDVASGETGKSTGAIPSSAGETTITIKINGSTVNSVWLPYGSAAEYLNATYYTN